MKEDILKLHPTQLAVGYQQVECKYEKIKALDKSGKLDKYLKEHVVPVIRGYNNKLYLIDHHHLCMACEKLQIKQVYINILYDWSHLSFRDFWNKMNESHYVWVYDVDDFPHMLPSNIKGLKDDPYRSLAGIVRKLGGFNKDTAPFAEFHWALFFKSKGLSTDLSQKTIDQAVFLCKSPEAKHLPGYI
jgi:hypothetical protein